jgi:hypothetical protein
MITKITTVLLIKRINYIKAYRNVAVSEHVTKTNDHRVPSHTFYSIKQPAPSHVSVTI